MACSGCHGPIGRAGPQQLLTCCLTFLRTGRSVGCGTVGEETGAANFGRLPFKAGHYS